MNAHSVSRETSRNDVSRETTDHAEAPSTPVVAQRVFLDRLSIAEAYTNLLATDGIVRGLIGPREVPRLWDRHLLNCAVVTDAVAPGASVADIGSGAGLPGLVMAIRRPDLQITLIEPLLRRTTFLDEACEKLALDNVTVRRGRAEEVHGSAQFDVVTSRAVAPMDRLARWSLPLVRSGGSFLAMKGSSAETEIATAGKIIERERGRFVRVQELGADFLEQPVRVVEIVKK
ncbi:16S rRNA (guanine527-N7)-methyltransferase [Marmoricola sp. OAE513]|uniref:16S rRNA (guanine(527)-N(7))-methyltransferase RsmG n=1 Tax=Marmoricola sp. OAE513 TaxID=2817894 RepID=UPI001DF77AB4